MILCHGFPELAYSWRHQLAPLAAAGYQAIAVDQRGYGLTDRPSEVSSLHDRGVVQRSGRICWTRGRSTKPCFCGHDWGGLVVWMMPLLHPDRVAGVIGVNTPLMRRARRRRRFRSCGRCRGDDNYMVAFQQPGVADKLLAADVRKTFTLSCAVAECSTPRSSPSCPRTRQSASFNCSNCCKPRSRSYSGEVFLTPEELNFFRRHLHQDRFHRRHQLVSKHRSQLGADQGRAVQD